MPIDESNINYFLPKIALGDIDRDHRPKDVKTVISEMEEKHCKLH